MSAIRRHDRNGAWWVSFRFRGRRVRKLSPIQTKRGAEAYERALRNELVAHEEAGRDPFAGPPPMFAEFAELWMKQYAEPNNRPSSVYSKGIALRTHLVPEFGRLRLNEITTARIDAFTAKLRKLSRAPKTVNNLLSVLRRSLTCAVEWGQLSHVPQFRWQRVPWQGYRYLEPEQATRMLAAAGSSRLRPEFWYTLILFFLRTGARFSEAAVLRWSDLRLEDVHPAVKFWRARSRDIEGPTKTNICRTIPLASDIVEVLRAWQHDGERVFQLGPDRPIKANNLQWFLDALCKMADVPHISWKDFRHTFATDLTRRGVPLNIVQRLLGHTTIQMTIRYAHTPDSSLEEAVELLASPARQERIRTIVEGVANNHQLEQYFGTSVHPVATKDFSPVLSLAGSQ